MSFLNSKYLRDCIAGASTVFINILFSLLWSYNYLAVVVEERLKPYGFFLKPVVIKTEPPLEKWNCSAYVESNKLVEHYEYGVEKEFFVFSDPVDCPIYLQSRRASLGQKCEGYMLSKMSVCDPEFAEANEVRFLNILYSHPKMNECVKLTLDKAYIRSGNEVFSKTFVLRMLQYQCTTPYHFDDDYELHIMDNKIKKHVLKSMHYLQFKGKESYDIKHIS